MYKMQSDSLLQLGGVSLTEHNRSPLSVDFESINRQTRTVEGYMRRQHVATKRQFSVSWSNLPHESAYTVDNKLGAEPMIDLFESLMLQGTTLITGGQTYNVLVDSYDYEVTMRRSYEFWNVSLSLVEI